jgi:TonB-dependent starch-binding outer membrane protein SusC
MKKVCAHACFSTCKKYILYWANILMLFLLFGFTQAFANMSNEKKFTVVKGIVKGSDGEVIPGVNVTVKGKPGGSVTNDDGAFSINVNVGDVLVFTAVGYQSKEVIITGLTDITVVMESSSTELSQVIISGYTTQSKKDFTGSAARVSAKQIENRPIQSFEQALAGQAPGVNIIQPNGVLNNTPVFRIRGVNSVSLSSYPLIIIDGIAVYTGSFGTKAPNNPLSNINPSDIESVDILKDASATAIYGSRAAGGVVVITTKRGKKGKTKVNANAWVGFSKPVNLPKMLNAEQYVAIKNEGLANAGQQPAFFLDHTSDGKLIDVDWYKYGYQTGVSQNYDVNFSGATDATSYYISAGVSDQSGILRTNTFKRQSLNARLDHKLFKNFTVGGTFNYTNTNNKAPSTGSVPGQSFQIDGTARAVMMLWPNVSPYNEDGSYNMNGGAIGKGANTISSAYYNQVAIIDNDYHKSGSNTVIANAFAEWQILKGLKLKSSYAMNRINTEALSFYSPLQGIGYANNGVATNIYSVDFRKTWNTTLNYNNTFGDKHNVNVLLGYEGIKSTSKQWGAESVDLTDLYYTNYQGAFAVTYPVANYTGINGLQSYFSSLHYGFDKRYLLNFSFRRDGYSGLAAGHKFGNFMGGSIGWNIANESFFQNSSLHNIISDLRIKASYGTVGNVNIGDFPSLSLYSTNGLYGDLPILYSSQVGNADLRWETNTKTDIGFEFSLWQGKINVQADYYRNDVDNMILNAKQSPSKGIPGNSISSNVGSMYNKGFEFNIIARVIEKNNFSWTVNFNLSTLQNKVTKLADNNADILGNSGATSGAIELASITRVGYAVGSIFVPVTTGVNPDNGRRMYLNRNNEVVQYDHTNVSWTHLDGSPANPIDGVLDAVVIGSALPSYYGGFNNSFAYKNFDVDLGFSFQGGNKIYWGTGATLLDGRYHNNSVKVLERWTKPGDITDVPRIVYGDNTSNGGSLSNSGNVVKGDYVKLRNASIGYRLPLSLVSKIKLSSIRIYAQGTNLLTFTKYPGSDPEVSVNGNDSSAPGADKNSAPSARIFTFGINVGF